MRIIIELDNKNDTYVQFLGENSATPAASTGLMGTSPAAQSQMKAVDGGQAKFGTEVQGQQTIQNENSTGISEGSSAGAGPGGNTA